jgi:drug/metabolite transporter (DMT)-like permease
MTTAPATPAPIVRVIRITATLAALGTALAFAGYILATPGASLEVHEAAGVVLLILVVIALWAAQRWRTLEPRPVSRLLGALGALIVMGALGAFLGIGVLPATLSFAPLLALAALVLLLGDAAFGPAVPRYRTS